MLINKDMLIRLAKDQVARRLRQPNEIVSIYLTGSVLGEDPLIGGATDIDMVIVHKEDPPVEREVLRVSYEVSFDIVHHHQSLYTFHRRLRQDPWLGYALCNHGAVLYNADHWFDFIHAGVSSQFDAPENVHARALKFADRARQQWFDLEDPQDIPFDAWVDLYLKTVNSAANIVAVVTGPALTLRRFMLDYPVRAEAVDQLSLSGDLARLVGMDYMSADVYQDWRPVWETVLSSASQQPDCPPNLHKTRKGYFLNSCDALAESGSLHACLWPMLETWRQAMPILEDNPAVSEAWHTFLTALGFEPAAKEYLVKRLDAFIDASTAVLDKLKQEYGL